MILELAEIDDMYKQIESILYPSFEYLASLSEEGIVEYKNQKEMADRVYKIAYEKFWSIASKLSATEIIEAYTEGSELLRGNIAGLIREHFDIVYVPLMIQAIKDGDHYGYAFLVTLYNYLGKQVIPIIMISFSSKEKRIRESALALARELDLTEAIPKIREMVMDLDEDISRSAIDTLSYLESKLN